MSSGPGARNTSVFTPYTAYSMNGTAEGKLIYINKGTKEDFEELEKHNISVNGSILIGRNGLTFYPTVSDLNFQETDKNMSDMNVHQIVIL